MEKIKFHPSRDFHSFSPIMIYQVHKSAISKQTLKYSKENHPPNPLEKLPITRWQQTNLHLEICGTGQVWGQTRDPCDCAGIEGYIWQMETRLSIIHLLLHHSHCSASLKSLISPWKEKEGSYGLILNPRTLVGGKDYRNAE
jgi:hypothetical protein